MDIIEHFRAVAAIFEESIKLLPRNGKFFGLIAVISAVLYASLSLVFNFSTLYLASDMLVKQYNPYPSSAFGSSTIGNTFDGIMKDFRLLLFVDVSFLCGIFLVSLFTTITTVIVSQSSYSSKTLSIKGLVLQVVKSWMRPLITSFYTELLAVGYLFVVISIASPLVMFSQVYMLPVAVVVGIAACIFFHYLSVILLMALVVSVMEENNYGIHALGKAGILIEGKRLQGFILNIFLVLLYWFLLVGFRFIGGKKLMANQTVFWIYVSIMVCLVKILRLAMYTVLYFHCKKEHGEETELQGSVSYKKLSIDPPFSDAA